MSDQVPPAAGQLLAALPNRPLSILEYNTLLMEATASALGPPMDPPLCDFRERDFTDQLTEFGNVVSKRRDWEESRYGIIGFRFRADGVWVSVGFEADTGWSVIHTDAVGTRGIGVIGDRIGMWAETFYGEFSTKRLDPLETCFGTMLVFLSEPVSEGTLTDIFSDTIWEDHPVEITIHPLATVTEGDTKRVIAFQYKLRFPGWRNWVAHGTVYHRPATESPGSSDHDHWIWRVSHLDNVGADGALALEKHCGEIACAIEHAGLYHDRDDISLEVPLPPAKAQVLNHLQARTPDEASPPRCDASVFAVPVDVICGLNYGKALVGVAGPGDPADQVVLGYHTIGDRRIYSGLNPNTGDWEQVTAVDKAAGTGKDRPPRETTALENWLDSNYGPITTPQSDHDLVPLVPWEASIPHLFATPSESTEAADASAADSDSIPAHSSTSASVSASQSPPPDLDPEEVEFIGHLAAETCTAPDEIAAAYQKLKEHEVPTPEAKQTTRRAFNSKTTTPSGSSTATEGSSKNPDRDSTEERGGIHRLFNWFRD